jgi:prepilin-type N-terminal cleavage/methylation domain-containing protein
LHKSAPNPRTRRRRIAGFSMVELAVSMTILLILSALAIPSLLQSFRTYQLNSAAARLSDMLKFTRYEAVRLNRPISFLMQPSGNGWLVGADSNLNGNIDPTDKQAVINGFVTLVTAGTPPPTAITNALNVGGLTATPANPGPLRFDARGAVRVNGALTANLYVFYVGAAPPANPGDFGFRAVILLPTGATQTWTATAAGPWQRIA